MIIKQEKEAGTNFVLLSRSRNMMIYAKVKYDIEHEWTRVEHELMPDNADQRKNVCQKARAKVKKYLVIKTNCNKFPQSMKISMMTKNVVEQQSDNKYETIKYNLCYNILYDL